MALPGQTAFDIGESILALSSSGLFDADWYRATYGVDAASCGEPLVDFCNFGWRELRRPNYHFDTAWYCEQNPEVASRGVNPLLHYLRIGEHDNRCPAAHFDVEWYRQRYGLGEGQSCLAHHLCHRRAGPTSPNGWFDAVWYVRQYASEIADADPFEHYARVGSREERCMPLAIRQISASGLFDARHYRACYGVEADEVCLIEHFCRTGWQAGFNPNRHFDTSYYLERNGDVRLAGINPLLHYIIDGGRESRVVSEVFDAEQYRSAHGTACSLSPLASYVRATSDKADMLNLLQAVTVENIATDTLLTDTHEVIQASRLFDDNYYLIQYPDVRLDGIAPLEHFCRYGEREGRRPNAYFDPDWYRLTTPMQGSGIENTLLHYILIGETAGKRPIIYFDSGWYSKQYELKGSVSPLAHYLWNRRQRPLSPTPLFDAEDYARRFGAVVGSNRDLFAHFLRVGIMQDINPGPLFDSARYRSRHMEPVSKLYKSSPGSDVYEKIGRERLNPLVHFLWSLEPSLIGVAPAGVDWRDKAAG